MIKKLIGPITIIVAIILVAVLVMNKPRPETKEIKGQQALTLLTTKLSPEKHPLMIPAEGFVSSRWQTTLSSQVAGQVIEISDKLLVGNQFSKGDVLLKINPLDYQVQLARAEANLKSAESNLAEQQMQAERARSDWNKLNPDRKPSDFNLRLPQLGSAQSNLQAAKDELRLAHENLDRTQIKAPFDGFSVSRSVDLGEQVQIGGVVAEIIDGNNLELKLSLTLSQATLIEQAENTRFMLIQPASEQHLQSNAELSVANIRFEPFIESQNRWRSMTLELVNQSNNVLLGQFLGISIISNQADEMLALPESALSIDGRIWYVDAESRTKFFEPDVIYKNSATLYLGVNRELKYPIDVVVSPPNSILPDTEVTTELWRPGNVAE